MKLLNRSMNGGILITETSCSIANPRHTWSYVSNRICVGLIRHERGPGESWNVEFAEEEMMPLLAMARPTESPKRKDSYDE